MHRKPLRIFTSVWGDKHVDWFEKYCLFSLKWPKNSEALEGATWTVLTTDKDKDKIKALIDASKIKIKDVNLMILPADFNPHHAGTLINQGLLMEMQYCISYGAQMFLAPPDTIFGNGSIASMREMARQRDSVIFAAHIRVLPEIQKLLFADYCVLSNAELVSAAIKYAHATWTCAQDGLEGVNSYVGGISWKWIADKTYAVTHRLPTPYLINWTPEDIVFFKNQLHWGVIDHAWPHDCLIHTERMRLCGSSDAAFMVEITEAQNNIPPVAAYHEDEPDLFWRNLSHNKVNRMFSVILRGE